MFGELVCASAAMKRVLGTLARLAGHDAIVLVTGESGTGKELAARALHTCGPRRDGPFVALNAASMSKALFESELFGHEKGAFTGADERRTGAFHAAHGGTLFVDEIGELELELQAKLLRTFETGEVRRVGSSNAEYPDVRVVCATHRDLAARVAEGRFRADLYYRLSILHVHLPPLRERAEDVRVLVNALLARHHPGVEISDEAVAGLEQWHWPGNVRELKNVLTRAVVLAARPGRIELADLTLRATEPAHLLPRAASLPSARAARAAAQEAERRELEALFRDCGGNVREMARRSGIGRSTLGYKLEKFGIRKESDE